MKKCRNEFLMEKIGINKLEKTHEVTLEALSNLPDCRQINAKNYIKIAPVADGSVTPSFNRYRVPKNQFECMRTGCVNTGTLTLGDAAAKVDYHIAGDAREFAAGVITFYATKNTAVTVLISDTSDFANADKYTVTPTHEGPDGYFAVVIDLSSTPTDEGDGWTPSEKGAYIQIQTAAGQEISSIAIFDSIEDFETSRVVKIGCLTGLASDIAIEAAETTCRQSGYDTNDVRIERTITGKKITPNYWWLNPLNGKGTATKGFVIVTEERTVDENGMILLADAADDCGFLSVAIPSSCDVTEAQLTKLSIPTAVDTDEGHYLALRSADGLKLKFNIALKGQTLVVSYPKEVEVEEEVGDVDNIGSVRVRYTEEYTATDGTRYVMVFNNVLVTSFPFTINEDETEFSFTITIQPDSDGHLYHKYRVLA